MHTVQVMTTVYGAHPSLAACLSSPADQISFRPSGVTYIGAKDQIAKQLVQRGDIPSDAIFHVSSYIAKTVLNCIGDLFGGARAIQDWLTISARFISRLIPEERLEAATQMAPKYTSRKTSIEVPRLGKEMMTSVVWTTPLGLPVVQPYRKPVRKQVRVVWRAEFLLRLVLM